MKRPDDITRFVRCGGMHCDNSCEDDGKVERCLTWRVHTYIEELEKQLPRWISVVEELPKKDGWYMVCMKASPAPLVTILRFLREHNVWANREYDVIPADVVTHWMPLPEPPKEE